VVFDFGQRNGKNLGFFLDDLEFPVFNLIIMITIILLRIIDDFNHDCNHLFERENAPKVKFFFFNLKKQSSIIRLLQSLLYNF